MMMKSHILINKYDKRFNEKIFRLYSKKFQGDWNMVMRSLSYIKLMYFEFILFN